MPIPKQQQKQLEEAEALHRRFYGGEKVTEDPAAGDDPNLSLVGDAPEAPPKEEAPKAEAPPKKEAPKAEAPPKEEAPKDPYSGDYAKLLQAHKTLQGKYESETARAQDQIQAMSGRLHDLENLLASASSAPAEAPASTEIESLLSPQELEDYGEDMIDVVKRAAREAVGKELAELRAENAQLKTQLGGVQQTTAQTARQTMLNDLDRDMSEWRQINTDPAFVQWAEELDTFSGQRRIDMLRAAFEQNNTPRVLSFFKAYAKENAAYQTNPQNETAAKPQVDLHSLVAPGRATDGSDPRAQEERHGRQWTQAEIQRFYGDVQRGVYKNDPAKKQAIEEDIFAAQSEGRIVA